MTIKSMLFQKYLHHQFLAQLEQSENVKLGDPIKQNQAERVKHGHWAGCRGKNWGPIYSFINVVSFVEINSAYFNTRFVTKFRAPKCILRV